MCLAIPGKIVSIENGEARIDYGGVTRSAELMLLPQARVGDMVIVHAGFAIAILDKEAGDELMRLTAETESYGAAKS